MNLPATPSLLATAQGAVLHVGINRPAARNAMNEQVLADLAALFDHLTARADLRVVVLRGVGGHFCAGGDVKDFSRLAAAPGTPAAPGVDPVAAFNRRFGALLEQVNAAAQATVAVTEGTVLGGGLGLACVADVTVTREDASFGLPETGLGVLPAQIAPFVALRIGLSQARRLAVCGGRFDGVEAQRLGLAHFVEHSPAALESRLAQVIRQILRCGPKALSATKAIMLAVGQQPLPQLLDEAARRFSATLASPEAAEGTAAFIEKRLPNWAGFRNQESGIRNQEKQSAPDVARRFS